MEIDKFRRYEINGVGETFKNPVKDRIKKSKFARLLTEMSDQEIKALGYCLIISPKIKDAIDCFSQSVEHGVQLYALQKEYEKRFE